MELGKRITIKDIVLAKWTIKKTSIPYAHYKNYDYIRSIDNEYKNWENRHLHFLFDKCKYMKYQDTYTHARPLNV